jgi:hypothetical protein
VQSICIYFQTTINENFLSRQHDRQKQHKLIKALEPYYRAILKEEPTMPLTHADIAFTDARCKPKYVWNSQKPSPSRTKETDFFSTKTSFKYHS